MWEFLSCPFTISGWLAFIKIPFAASLIWEMSFKNHMKFTTNKIYQICITHIHNIHDIGSCNGIRGGSSEKKNWKSTRHNFSGNIFFNYLKKIYTLFLFFGMFCKIFFYMTPLGCHESCPHEGLMTLYLGAASLEGLLTHSQQHDPHSPDGLIIQLGIPI